MKTLKRLEQKKQLMFKLFHYFNFQLHVGFKNLYQNFQGGQKKFKGGGQIPWQVPFLSVSSSLSGCDFMNYNFLSGEQDRLLPNFLLDSINSELYLQLIKQENY